MLSQTYGYKRSLKAFSQHTECGKGFGSCKRKHLRSSSSFSSSSAAAVAADFDDISCVSVDFIDLLGEDIDNFFDEDSQSSDGEDDDNIISEHVTNFWTSTIDWGKVDLSFTREGESRRTIQRKRLTESRRESSIKQDSLIQYLVPLVPSQSVQLLRTLY